ncbi:MAG: ABC transporter permease [Bacteroidia bacterium]|nr:ABC transporter permease [Bacteroidia bacterium]
MYVYILKRILGFFPTLLVISLLAFMISVFSEVDPVRNHCQAFAEGMTFHRIVQCENKFREKYNQFLPVFYLEVASLAEPDTLSRIYPQTTRKALQRLTFAHGKWENVQKWYISLQVFYDSVALFPLTDISTDSLPRVKSTLAELLRQTRNLMQSGKTEAIGFRLAEIEKYLNGSLYLLPLKDSFSKVQKSRVILADTSSRWKTFCPKIIWHGTANRYHRWLSAIVLKGDFGTSWTHEKSVSERMGALFFYSFLFTVISVFLAYGLGIPLGIGAAIYHNQWFDRISGMVVFALDALPAFWVATLLLIFFANPDRFDWFPSAFNTVNPQGWTYFSRFVLPVIAYTYGSFAAVSRIMRVSMLEVLGQDFVRTARAKGAGERRVIIRHALRNALLPMITGFVGIFPAVVSGSVILENIFTIPGMGSEIMVAVQSNNIPMILAVFTLTGLLTVTGYLVADLLYMWADPRIRFTKEN